MDIPEILNLILWGLVIIVAMLGAIYLLIWWSNKQKSEEPKQKEDKKTASSNGGVYTKDSVYKFMEFDEIKDNMIIRKNKEQFVMVIQCQGVNYDLMSAQEKLAIEEGFVQFLNALRFPIQLYVQTTSLNFKDIIEEYKLKVQTVEE